MKRHQRIHFKTKKFHCDHCVYGANRKGNLKVHIINYHLTKKKGNAKAHAIVQKKI
jgi:hypothetical protein